MFSAQRFMIDRDGEWHQFPFDSRFFNQLGKDGEVPQNYELILYAVENLGFVSLKIGIERISIRINPKTVNQSSLHRTVTDVIMGDRKSPLMIECWKPGGWDTYEFPNAIAAQPHLDNLLSGNFTLSMMDDAMLEMATVN